MVINKTLKNLSLFWLWILFSFSITNWFTIIKSSIENATQYIKQTIFTDSGINTWTKLMDINASSGYVWLNTWLILDWSWFNQKFLALNQSGYLIYASELDPIFTNSPAYSITQSNINNWNSMYNRILNSWAYLWTWNSSTGNLLSSRYINTWSIINSLAISNLSCNAGQIISRNGSIWTCVDMPAWAGIDYNYYVDWFTFNSWNNLLTINVSWANTVTWYINLSWVNNWNSAYNRVSNSWNFLWNWYNNTGININNLAVTSLNCSGYQVVYWNPVSNTWQCINMSALAWTDRYVNGMSFDNSTNILTLHVSWANDVTGHINIAAWWIGDNLGNHIATENIRLNNHWLSNDGDSEWIKISNIGNIWINNNTPVASLHIKWSGNTYWDIIAEWTIWLWSTPVTGSWTRFMRLPHRWALRAWWTTWSQLNNPWLYTVWFWFGTHVWDCSPYWSILWWERNILWESPYSNIVWWKHNVISDSIWWFIWWWESNHIRPASWSSWVSYSTIWWWYDNSAYALASTVVWWHSNIVNDYADYGSIVWWFENKVQEHSKYGFVWWGDRNHIYQYSNNSTIVWWSDNRINSWSSKSFIWWGIKNRINWTEQSFIWWWNNNLIYESDSSVIVWWVRNKINWPTQASEWNPSHKNIFSSIVWWNNNEIKESTFSIIWWGINNIVENWSNQANILWWNSNTIWSSEWVSIVWGNGNEIRNNSNRSQIAGWSVNKIVASRHSNIAGWWNNEIENVWTSTIVWWSYNAIKGWNKNWSSIWWWQSNNIQNSNYAFIAGWFYNIISWGDYSFVGWSYAEALHKYSFIWNWDESFTGFQTTKPYTFIVNSPWWVGIGTNEPINNGLSVAGAIQVWDTVAICDWTNAWSIKYSWNNFYWCRHNWSIRIRSQLNN